MAASNLANLPVPPVGSIQFFDGYFPALPANTYSIVLKHTLSGNANAPSAFEATQAVTVQAPEFAIDPGIIQTFYPPNGASDIYAEKLPFIVLTDPSLPWERNLIPNSGEPDPSNPTAWLALLIFAESEMILPANTNNPVTSAKVSGLIATGDGTTLKPQFPTNWASADVLNSQCQTVTIPGAVFNAIVPSTTELPFLTHCRGVNTLDEGEQLLSILLANRLPQAAANPVGPQRYFAHLVSLEGFGAYMGPNGTVPFVSGTQTYMNVQMVSLFNWSFTSLPESGESFTQLMPPQPLPPTRNPAAPVRQANTADELMIYLAEQGLFDLSYAASWNLGRNLALADAVFARNVTLYRNAVQTSFATLAQRRAMHHLSSVKDQSALLASNASRRIFTSRIVQGMGQHWTHALSSVRLRESKAVEEPNAALAAAAPLGSIASVRPTRRFSARPAVHPRLAVASPQAVAAVSTDVSEIIESVTAWLAKLTLLYPVPFSHLVPDPRMLPVESIRFFYLDSNWTDALVAGALSIAMHSSADVQQQVALMPTLRTSINGHRARSFRRIRPDAAPNPGNAAGNVAGNLAANGNGVNITGVLIRSAVVSGWPNMVVTATVGGAPLNTVRDDSPSSTVRLCLFDGIPDTVTLAEPYQGVLFGVEDTGVFPRCVTAPAYTGSQIANGTAISPTFRTPPSSSLGGVLNVQTLAAALEPAVGITPFVSGAVVNWNGSALTTTFVNGNQLTATVPANLIATASAAAITVTSGGATSQPQNFIVNAPLEIDTINPVLIAVGVNGFLLTVDGVGFVSGAKVQWNGAALATTPISINQITAVVPANLVTSPSTASITVVAGGVTSNQVPLAVVTADPIVNSIAPNLAMSGGSGFTLTVNGTGFANGAVVQWNGATLTTAFVSDQMLKATVPASLIAAVGSAQVMVLVNQASSNAVPFTITNANPTIGSLYPSVALADAGLFTLTVHGVNFGSSPTVGWGGNQLTLSTTPTAEQITVIVPANLVTAGGSVNVTVTSGGVVSNSQPFLVTGPQPAVGLLDPPEIIAGSPQFVLTVYGGFGAGDFALQMVAAPELQSFPTT